jgi:hypothetical protein
MEGMQFKHAVLSQDVAEHPGGVFDILRIFNTLHAPEYPATFSIAVTAFFEGTADDRGTRQPITVRLAGEAGTLDDVWTLWVHIPRGPGVLVPGVHATFNIEGVTLPRAGYYWFFFLDPDGGEIGRARFVAVYGEVPRSPVLLDPERG